MFLLPTCGGFREEFCNGQVLIQSWRPNDLETSRMFRVSLRRMILSADTQGALKGTNLRGQTEPKCRFSLIFAEFADSADFRRKTADVGRKPQKTAGTRRKLQIGICPLKRALDTQIAVLLSTTGFDLSLGCGIPKTLHVCGRSRKKKKHHCFWFLCLWVMFSFGVCHHTFKV